MEECQQLYEKLLKRLQEYNYAKDYPMLDKAYRLACEAHSTQVRKSGEPYIIHPLQVALILADLKLDIESIVAGILHDIVEDTDYSIEDIEQMFSKEVAHLVNGVTKLKQMNYCSKEEQQAENYRKMFLAMAKDIRVILIKVADRLHNMRTLNYMSTSKQLEKAQETLEIYAPIANRLGISKIKNELEDLAFKYLNPVDYYDISKKVKQKQSEREIYVNKVCSELKSKIEKVGIEAKIYGRPKHLFGIYKKMINQSKNFEQIFDLVAIRIIVNTVQDCYGALGIVHEMYMPIPSRFKDYIAMPKNNMYQSLHNTLVGPEGKSFEIQIRTHEMHRVAEYGIAAHWKYKEGITSSKTTSDEEKMTWLRQILEWQQDLSDNKEFMDTIKTDFDAFSENVYCFSPTGDVKILPYGSTPVDFAYSIHSAVGNKMVGAKVNEKIVTFNHKLQNGDRVEIITSQNSQGPKLDWLKFVKSSQSKIKISAWFKKANKEENITKGKELLEKNAKSKGYSYLDLATEDRIENILRRYNFKDWDAICAAVGHGGIKEGQIINRFIEHYEKHVKKEKTIDEIISENKKNIQDDENQKRPSKSNSQVIVQGIDSIETRISKCCSPVPGDEIIGFITKGRGISIHRTDCINIVSLSEDDKARLIETIWNKDNYNSHFQASFKIVASDRLGYFGDITRILNENKINIYGINAKALNSQVIIYLDVSISCRTQIDFILKKIMTITGTYEAERVNSFNNF